MGDGVEVRVADGSEVGVCVGRGVAEKAGVGVKVGRGVALGPGVKVAEGVEVGVGVGVMVTGTKKSAPAGAPVSHSSSDKAVPRFSVPG
jgi:hypothetical protein